jgi:nicotinate-nucleotide pyrophosphorylase (carboxylating)
MEFFESKYVDEIIDLALREDIGAGDITTDAIINQNDNADAFIISKADGIISGLPIAEMIFQKLGKNILRQQYFKDGQQVHKGDLIVEFSGHLRALLTGERTALNFLQRMSGISTATAEFVEAVKGTNVKILDTRKTAPGQRMLDKYAVKMGGGTNHRIGLYDMVMIKDNHIKAAGSITEAVTKVRLKTGEGIKIEVETTNADEVHEALAVKADIIMLDNMGLDLMKECVDIINHKALVEASGGVMLENLKAIAATGVDFISVGALTHSVKALDLSQYIK